jgi:hypothetical protein
VGALRPPNPGRYATPLGWRTAWGVGGVEALFKPLPRARAPCPGAWVRALARARHLLNCKGSPPLHTIATVVPQPGNLETLEPAVTADDGVYICVAYKAAYLHLYNPRIRGYPPPSRRTDPIPSGPGPGNVRPRDHATMRRRGHRAAALPTSSSSFSSSWLPPWSSSGVRGPGRPPRRETTKAGRSRPTPPAWSHCHIRRASHRGGTFGGTQQPDPTLDTFRS